MLVQSWIRHWISGVSFKPSLILFPLDCISFYEISKWQAERAPYFSASLLVHCVFPSDLSLTSERELFSPHSFTLRISKTDMQHSITLFSQTCLANSHTLSLPLCFTVFLSTRAEIPEAKCLHCKFILYVCVIFNFKEYIYNYRYLPFCVSFY